MTLTDHFEIPLLLHCPNFSTSCFYSATRNRLGKQKKKPSSQQTWITSCCLIRHIIRCNRTSAGRHDMPATKNNAANSEGRTATTSRHQRFHQTRPIPMLDREPNGTFLDKQQIVRGTSLLVYDVLLRPLQLGCHCFGTLLSVLASARRSYGRRNGGQKANQMQLSSLPMMSSTLGGCGTPGGGWMRSERREQQEANTRINDANASDNR